MFFLFSRPRWVVPVLPKGELEVLLEAAIDLSKKGRNPLNTINNQRLLFAVCLAVELRAISFCFLYNL